jgi:hypothetical protein
MDKRTNPPGQQTVADAIAAGTFQPLSRSLRIGGIAEALAITAPPPAESFTHFLEIPGREEREEQRWSEQLALLRRQAAALEAQLQTALQDAQEQKLNAQRAARRERIGIFFGAAGFFLAAVLALV